MRTTKTQENGRLAKEIITVEIHNVKRPYSIFKDEFVKQAH
jgi:hypothetical protein